MYHTPQFPHHEPRSQGAPTRRSADATEEERPEPKYWKKRVISPQTAPTTVQPDHQSEYDLHVGSAHTSAITAFRQAAPTHILLGLTYLPFIYIMWAVASNYMDLPASYDTKYDTVERIMLAIERSDIAWIGGATAFVVVIYLACVLATTTARNTHETGRGVLSATGFLPVVVVELFVVVVQQALKNLGTLGIVASVVFSILTLFAAAAAAHEVGLIAAFEESANIVMKCFSSSFALCLIASLYAIFCAVSGLVLAIALVPFIRVLLVTAYRQAKGLSIL